jgi:hypothetical protein
MATILPVLLKMLRLQAGPQDLPAGRGLLVVLVTLYLGHGFLAGLIVDEPEAMPRTLVAIAFQFAVIASLLKLKGFAERSRQTLSAMAGTGFLLGLASLLPLSMIQPGTEQPGLALAYFGLFAWSLAVEGHIYRHALSIKMNQGVLLAVLIFAANFVLLKTLFGS